jgi:SpoVK/Ycf46/Vps4 family AAA+-type ATPase
MAKRTPAVSPYYVERPEAYTKMESSLLGNKLNSQKIFVLYGMAGSGKTQSAAYFEQENRTRFVNLYGKWTITDF